MADVGHRGVVVQRDGDRSDLAAGQIDGGVVGTGEAEDRHEVPGAQGVLGVVIPVGRDRAQACPQCAIRNGVEPGQQPYLRASGHGNELLGAFGERGPLAVSQQGSLDDFGKPQPGFGGRLEYAGQWHTLGELRLSPHHPGDSLLPIFLEPGAGGVGS